MRHKWNGKLKRGTEYVTCVKCGCMKQRYYGLMLYFTDQQKDPFIKAPECKCKHQCDEKISYGNGQYFKKCADCGAEI